MLVAMSSMCCMRCGCSGVLSRVCIHPSMVVVQCAISVVWQVARASLIWVCWVCVRFCRVLVMRRICCSCLLICAMSPSPGGGIVVTRGRWSEPPISVSTVMSRWV